MTEADEFKAEKMRQKIDRLIFDVRCLTCTLYANYDPEAYNLFKCTDEQLEEFIKHLEWVKFELNSLTYNYVTSKTWRYLKIYREADDAKQ